MGSRYGRKKRRAHLDMIAGQDRAIINTQKRLEEARSNAAQERGKVDFLVNRIGHWDDEIRGLLGPYTSFAINDATYRVDHPDQIRQLPIVPPMPMQFSVDTMVGQESMTYYIETMLGFFVELEEKDLMRLRRLLTVRVRVGSNQLQDSAYYAFSEQAWHDLKRAGPDAWQRMVMRLAGDMIKLLAEPKRRQVAMESRNAARR